MNICMFGASFLPKRGGMEYVIHHLANALVKQGHDVTVIAARVSWAGIGVEYDYKLRRYGFPVRGLGTLGIQHIVALWAVWRCHRIKPFDILHCHSVSFAGTRAVRIKKLLGIPIVLTPHGEDIQRVPEIGYGLRLSEKWDAIITRNLNTADAVTAISMSVENELDCVDRSKVIRIANGVHISSYGKKQSQFLREKIDVDDETLLVLSVGRNHIKKGYDFGIKAIAKLIEKHNFNKVHYVIVGKGVSEHATLVSELSLEKYITLIEELAPEQARECYQSADIFFSPSIIEGLSLVSIEAISCGLPLVVTDVPGNEDIVRDTGAGVIVHTKDPEDMADGLYSLLCNKELRETLSVSAIKKSSRYDWSTIAKEYAVVYKKVIDGLVIGEVDEQ